MAEISFCPFCNAAQHKLVNCKKDVFFCKECDKFFRFDELLFKCPKCDKTNIGNSDFPTPDGSMVFQCKSCKKMYSAKEFFEKNPIK